MAALPPIAITAHAAVNALGRSTAEVLASLDAGRSGLAAPDFELPVETVVGAVAGPHPPLPAGYEPYDCRLSRVALMALADMDGALRAAVSRWGGDRVAVLLGTSTGGLAATERAYFASRRGEGVPADFDFRRQHDFNALGELVALLYGVTGPVYTVSTACSSSGKVHATAQRLLASGRVDAALVGGVDSLCRMTLQGFHGLGVLSREACRPFDAHRDGINIGEGAAFQLLERDGEALALLLGVGESTDAHHMSSPHPEGRGAAEAMQRALAQAGKGVGDVGYVNAHGTATRLNDSAEAIAIHTLFGDRVPVSSTKAFTGHLLGAAAATEATFAIHAVREGRVPPNLGCTEQDPEVRVRVVTEPVPLAPRLVLSNSFAFGGSNVCLAIGAAS